MSAIAMLLPLGWIWTPVAAAAALALAWVAYRAFVYPALDPLRVLPGPSGSRLFGVLPEIMREQTCAPQMRWVEQYGKTVLYRRTFGAPAVLTVDPDIVKRVLVTHGKIYGKSDRQLRLLRDALGNGLVTSVGATHAKHRALIKSHFIFQNLKAVFPIFVRAAHKLAAHWEEEWADTGKELDVIGSMSKFTLDVIGLSAFGYHFNATANPDGPLTTAFGAMLPKLDVWMILTAIVPPLRHVLAAVGIGPFGKRQSAVNVVRGKVDEIVAKRVEIARRAGEQGGDAEVHTLLDIMINDKYKDGTRMTPQELADQTITFLMAGHETTSNALTWTWFLLSKHPHVENKLREELIRAFPTGDDKNFTADDLERMPYLWAVCMESLRMFPPVPITNRTSVEDDVWMVGGKPCPIPKGTPVFILPYVMHHNPDHWEDPEEFRPERWYTDGDAMQERLRPKPFTFMPFIFGERSCIGQRFAVLEMQASLAILLRRFTLRRKPDAPEPKRKLTVTMRPSPNLLMTVHMA